MYMEPSPQSNGRQLTWTGPTVFGFLSCDHLCTCTCDFPPSHWLFLISLSLSLFLSYSFCSPFSPLAATEDDIDKNIEILGNNFHYLDSCWKN